MTLPKVLTTVTTLSKTIAFLLFIILPILAFYLGTKYDRVASKISNDDKIESTIVSPQIPVSEADTKRQMIEKCGKIPMDDLQITNGHFVSMKGPEWSPDCKHIAWSIFNSGTVVINPSGQSSGVKGTADEGIFIFEVGSKQKNKLEFNKSIYQSVSFERWENDNSIIFSSIYEGRVSGLYNIDSHQITPPKD